MLLLLPAATRPNLLMPWLGLAGVAMPGLLMFSLMFSLLNT